MPLFVGDETFLEIGTTAIDSILHHLLFFFLKWIRSFLFFQIFFFFFSATAPPIGRMGHSDVLVGNKIVYFGGTNGKQCFSDLWVFDTATMTWLRPRTAGRPPTKSKTRRKKKKKDFDDGTFCYFFFP